MSVIRTPAGGPASSRTTPRGAHIGGFRQSVLLRALVAVAGVAVGLVAASFRDVQLGTVGHWVALTLGSLGLWGVVLVALARWSASAGVAAMDTMAFLLGFTVGTGAYQLVDRPRPAYELLLLWAVVGVSVVPALAAAVQVGTHEGRFGYPTAIGVLGLAPPLGALLADIRSQWAAGNLPVALVLSTAAVATLLLVPTTLRLALLALLVAAGLALVLPSLVPDLEHWFYTFIDGVHV